MEMTFDIDPGLMDRVRAEAARRGITVSELVAAGLWQVLEAEDVETDAPLPPLPTAYGVGLPVADVADPETLDARVAEEDTDEELPPLPTWKGGGFVADVADREALDRAMASNGKDGGLPPLPTWHGGGPPLVDVADRQKLYEVLDAD